MLPSFTVTVVVSGLPVYTLLVSPSVAVNDDTFFLFIFIVYVASFVLPFPLSFAVITTVYVPAALLAGIVITPSVDTVIFVSPDFFSYVYEPVPFVGATTFSVITLSLYSLVIVLSVKLSSNASHIA